MSAQSRAFAPLDFLQLVVIALIWGVNNVAAKIAVDAFPPMLTAAMRFGIVLVVLAPWLKWPKTADIRFFLGMLLFTGPLHFSVLFSAFRMAHEVSPMVVAMQLWAPASVVFASLILKERAGPLRWLGVGVAFFGAAALNFDPSVFAQAGALATAGCASCMYGLGATLMRRVGPMSALGTQAWIALATAPTLGLASLLFEHGQAEAMHNANWAAWAAVIFAALASSVLASAMLFGLVQRYEVSRTTPYLLTTPIISFGCAAMVLGETITAQEMLATVLVTAGVALVALAERRTAV